MLLSVCLFTQIIHGINKLHPSLQTVDAQDLTCERNFPVAAHKWRSRRCRLNRKLVGTRGDSLLGSHPVLPIGVLLVVEALLCSSDAMYCSNLLRSCPRQKAIVCSLTGCLRLLVDYDHQ